MILSIKKDDSLNPSSSLKVLWKPLTIDFTWIYCTITIIALSPEPLIPRIAVIVPSLISSLTLSKAYFTHEDRPPAWFLFSYIKVIPHLY